MKRKPLVLVDGDMLVYLAGFVAQETSYSAAWFDMSDMPHEEHFQSAASLKEWQLENPECVLQDISPVVTPHPVEFALSIVKDKLKTMHERYGDFQLFIKGDGKNWRDSVATLYPYKGNRTAPKPFWHDAIREYMIDTWGAVQINGKEVDDHVATVAYYNSGKDVVVCHADKDLDQIPGTHWNYQKNVEYRVSHIDALLFFYQQALCGDTADNVKGCWKIGPGKAEAIINAIYEEYEDKEDTLEEALWDGIVAEYEASMGKDGCPYAGMPVDQVALENARLVWMQTEPNRLWTPPGHPLVYVESTLDD